MTAMRIVGWVAAGLVLGFVLGGIPAERERAALAARVDKLERELRRVDRPNILDSFLPRLGAGRGPAAGDEATPRARPSAAPDASVATGAPSAASESGAADAPPAPAGDVRVIGEVPERRPRRGLFGFRERRAARRGELEVYGAEGSRAAGAADDAPRTPLARFDEMATVQRARAAASRAALIEQAGLDEEQVARVDETVSRMNDQLAGYGEEMIDQVVQGERPGPAQALGLGHDVSGILLDGQKALDAIVGDAAEAVDPEALEVWNYVDVEQWRPFVEARTREAAAEPAPAEGSAGSGAAEGEE